LIDNVLSCVAIIDQRRVLKRYRLSLSWS